MRDVIPADDAERLRRLFRDLPALLWEAANAIRTDEGDHSLQGEQLSRFRRAEAKVSTVFANIRHIVDQ